MADRATTIAHLVDTGPFARTGNGELTTEVARIYDFLTQPLPAQDATIKGAAAERIAALTAQKTAVDAQSAQLAATIATISAIK